MALRLVPAVPSAYESLEFFHDLKYPDLALLPGGRSVLGAEAQGLKRRVGLLRQSESRRHWLQSRPSRPAADLMFVLVHRCRHPVRHRGGDQRRQSHQ